LKVFSSAWPIFGFFYLLQVLKSLVVHLEVVFMVAMIAIAHKVIILNLKEIQRYTSIGLAAIIISLSVGYYLIKKDQGI
jgi:uncharacterized membrane protein (DUF373 family)